MKGSALTILKGLLPIFYPGMAVPGGDPAAAPGGGVDSADNHQRLTPKQHPASTSECVDADSVYRVDAAGTPVSILPTGRTSRGNRHRERHRNL